MVQLSEGPVQRGNGKGGPTTPKPVILPKGQASAPPAEGEVAQLVARLRTYANVEQAEGRPAIGRSLSRAAELLQRQHPAPVPVSERLPGDQLSWWYEPDEEDGYGGRWTLLRIRGGTGTYSHWLPAHALPLPQGEAQQ